MLLLPESPYWLIQVGQDDQGIKSLKFFRKKPIDAEFEEIAGTRDKRLENQGNRSTIISQLTRPSFIQPFCIVGGLRLLLAWTGLSVMSAYLVTIFDIIAKATGMDPKIGQAYFFAPFACNTQILEFLGHFLVIFQRKVSKFKINNPLKVFRIYKCAIK